MQYESPSLEMLVFDIKDSISNGRVTKDFNVSDDLIKFWILSKREKYLKQQTSKGKNINEFVQDLGCVTMSFVDKSSCCSVNLDCKFLRSDLPLPYFIGNPTRIGPIDVTSKNWQLINYERLPLELYAPKYSRKGIKAFFKDFEGYLYIYYNPEYYPEGKFLTTINVQGILVDPQMAAPFNNCSTGTSCYSDSTPFPISLSLWTDIRRDILYNELRITQVTTEDDSNNSKADTNVNDLRKLK